MQDHKIPHSNDPAFILFSYVFKGCESIEKTSRVMLIGRDPWDRHETVTNGPLVANRAFRMLQRI